ncbi:hypothetical protein QO002_002150 [Pararhizobium capsulatum DSM 1112]|uniref:Uncharacterized protein n=1 Tax=Pararhizobium capsulatum DSM 1112 TaxID=1121113 RepID=A0ABU0BPX0_9HYPH|nr:hypothetical protein [Pararhizobium capsulatum DSM 1112]
MSNQTKSLLISFGCAFAILFITGLIAGAHRVFDVGPEIFSLAMQLFVLLFSIYAATRNRTSPTQKKRTAVRASMSISATNGKDFQTDVRRYAL